MKLSCLLLIAGLTTAACAQAQTPPPVPMPSGSKAALQAVMNACKGQTPQLCPGLSGNTALACLQSNIEKLAPSCKDAVVKAAKASL